MVTGRTALDTDVGAERTELDTAVFENGIFCLRLVGVNDDGRWRMRLCLGWSSWLVARAPWREYFEEGGGAEARIGFEKWVWDCDCADLMG